MTKGYFIIKLVSTEDKECVWHGETWVIQNQQLRVFNFYPNFDPERQNTTRVTVWVSFPGLYIELWTKKILLSIAKILGKPIAIDQKTLYHDVGNYAAVTIDIDFAKMIPKRIRLKANGKEFWQYVEIQDLENIKFCTHYKFMGHKFENCLAARKILGSANAEKKYFVENVKNEKEDKTIKYAWKERFFSEREGVQSEKGNVTEVATTSNVVSKATPVQECAEDKLLKEELNNSFIEYREAQLKLISCKNDIVARKGIAARTESSPEVNVAVTQVQTGIKSGSVTSLDNQNSMLNLETQQASVAKQNSEQQRENFGKSKQTLSKPSMGHIQAVTNSESLNTNQIPGSIPNSSKPGPCQTQFWRILLCLLQS
ncbi:uncharacterized protein LOC113360139 [Papaver somniferum]|uniref:uncharacterized protein LOC113360139 n=1 Tax=Papaver somniferum TaxID=3469 RepID=UPI000E703CA1|nr:uncharacterized protein LOC113360139 [Papaver somniferum]